MIEIYNLINNTVKLITTQSLPLPNYFLHLTIICVLKEDGHVLSLYSRNVIE